MTTNIYREDPPEGTNGRKGSTHHADVASQLEDDPGNWYRIADGQKYPELAARIRTAKLKAYQPAGAFEGVARKLEDDTWSIWARYVGEA